MILYPRAAYTIRPARLFSKDEGYRVAIFWSSLSDTLPRATEG